MDRTDRVGQWQLDLMADTAARADSIAAVVAARLLVDGWDDELAAVVRALERIGADLERVRREHQSGRAA